VPGCGCLAVSCSVCSTSRNPANRYGYRSIGPCCRRSIGILLSVFTPGNSTYKLLGGLVLLVAIVSPWCTVASTLAMAQSQIAVGIDLSLDPTLAA
jgi:hypothetical protein